MPIKAYKHPFQFGSESPVAVDFMTYAVRKMLPKYRVCPDPKPPFYLFGADSWNCAKCKDEKDYFLPIVSDDKFQFQFQFDDQVNADPTAPVFGWKESGSDPDEYYISVRLLDCACNPIDDLDFVDLIADSWGVAYDAVGGSFQWFRFDMGLIPTEICCFNIEVTKYTILDSDLVPDIIITGGPFARADSNTCSLCEKETVLISGSWKKVDCWGRRFDVQFGDEETKFTDSVRLEGFTKFLGSSPESVYDDEVEVKTTIRNKYRLSLRGVPPMIAQWISTILASNSTLVIDGIEIDRSRGDTVGAFDRDQQGVELFYGSVDFSTVCEVQNFGCS